MKWSLLHKISISYINVRNEWPNRIMNCKFCTRFFNAALFFYKEKIKRALAQRSNVISSQINARYEHLNCKKLMTELRPSSMCNDDESSEFGIRSAFLNNHI